MKHTKYELLPLNHLRCFELRCCALRCFVGQKWQFLLSHKWVHQFYKQCFTYRYMYDGFQLFLCYTMIHQIPTSVLVGSRNALLGNRSWKFMINYLNWTEQIMINHTKSINRNITTKGYDFVSQNVAFLSSGQRKPSVEISLFSHKGWDFSVFTQRLLFFTINQNVFYTIQALKNWRIVQKYSYCIT